MPKGFSDREKEIISAKLLERGRELIETYGVRRTNVEDLTRAAGISKGAFYLFYDSKEALFMDVLEQYEAGYRARLLQKINAPGGNSREAVRAVFQEAFTAWRTHPLFKNFNKEEYELLLRKLPPEKVQAHLSSDENFVCVLLDAWKENGLEVQRDPKIVAGLSKALFFASMHDQEIGPSVYAQTMNTLIDLFVDYLLESNHDTH